MIDYDVRAWTRTVLQLRGSVVPRILPRVAVAIAIGAGAIYLHRQTGFHLPAIGHTLMSVALGLLLVFRTNASYDRFWEGRRLVGAYTNRARDLARQIVAYVTDETERAALLRLVSLHYAVTVQMLRGERDLDGLGLTLEERAALEDCAGRPMRVFTWIGQRLAQAVTRGALPEPRLLLLDPNLTAFSDAWGGAERIVRTPIPFAYAQHIKTFLVLFTFTAPFAMVDSMGLLTPIAVGLLAFALFGIEEIGIEIEDPFGHDANDLPLDRIGETIRRDLDIAAHTSPEGVARHEGRSESGAA